MAEIATTNPIEYIFCQMQSSDETCCCDASQGTDQSEQYKHDESARLDRERLKRRHVEGGRITEEPATNERCSSGRDRDRKECPHAHLRHHQLDSEHHATDWGIEGGRNACARARGDERDPLARGHAYDLPHRRAKRRADLDDRPFPAD